MSSIAHHLPFRDRITERRLGARSTATTAPTASTAPTAPTAPTTPSAPTGFNCTHCTCCTCCANCTRTRVRSTDDEREIFMVGCNACTQSSSKYSSVSVSASTLRDVMVVCVDIQVSTGTHVRRECSTRSSQTTIVDHRPSLKNSEADQDGCVELTTVCSQPTSTCLMQPGSSSLSQDPPELWGRDRRIDETHCPCARRQLAASIRPSRVLVLLLGLVFAVFPRTLGLLCFEHHGVRYL